MTFERLSNFIGGAFIASASSENFDLIDPTTGSVNGVSPKSNADDVERALNVAQEAFKCWRETTPSQRQHYLLKLADALEAESEAIIKAQSRNTGQLYHMLATEEMAPGIDQIRFFAGAARMLEGRASAEYIEGLTSSIRREPLGVIAQVAPWNYPFMMAVWKVIPAIAAGNTVVLKPSDTTPESTLLFAKIAADILPKGVFNVILGDAETGALLMQHPLPQMVSITGSVRAGREVATAAAQNLTKSHLELGGKAPVIVFADSDLDRAADHIAMTGLFNAGQDCTAATRVLVEASIYDQFLNKLVERTKNYSYGSPGDESAHYGPLNNARQLKRIEEMIARLPPHGKIEIGGKQADRPGYYFEATVISGLTQEDELIQTEIFGPVITVQSFINDDDALEQANGVIYGLAASVWTESHSRAQHFAKYLDFGTVWLNTHIPLTAEMPHGGFKSSGYGKDLSLYGLEEYTRIKHVMSALN